jgi:undecaprenyl phosphate N,N'-diacetylbacillosamine 1-phosphate transferase
MSQEIVLRKTLYNRFFKRLLDILFSFIAIVLLSLFFLVVGLLVRIKLGSPVIFKQKRPGRNNKIFTLYKFRTMTNEKDGNSNLLPDEKRLTKFGKFLRSTSLDELPELFNILKGDMSIVGPRPQLIKDMVFFDDEVMKRQLVRPGLTGLAQVKGRNNISWEEKFSYDLEYIKKITFINDIKIIFKTILVVLKRSNINTDGMATAEDYGDYLLRNGKISLEMYKEKMALYQKT